MKLKRILFFLGVMSLFGFSWPFTWLPAANSERFGSSPWLTQEMHIIKSREHSIDDKVLRTSLVAYMNALRKGYARKQLLTVIDYSKPSYEKRLWVFDMRNGRTLFNTWVTHGRNSGGINSTSFSNMPGSLKSSLGVFVTASPYVGKNGYSLHLRGLERGINDYAYSRAIVIHGAEYVNPDIIRRYGQIGRSWGCPAVSTDLSKPLINTIKNDTVVVAYYPDRRWLSNSRFLVG